MKKILIAIVVGALASSAFAIKLKPKPSYQQSHPRQEDNTVADVKLQRNQHVFKYTPNLVKQPRLQLGYHCTVNGNPDSGRTPKGQITTSCLDYKSKDGVMWRIRFGGQGSSAEYVFKMVNGSPVLWAQFDPNNQRLLYASAGANTYAANHGGSPTQMANEGQRAPAPLSNDPCAQLQGAAKAMCMGAGKALPALGAIFK